MRDDIIFSKKRKQIKSTSIKKETERSESGVAQAIFYPRRHDHFGGSTGGVSFLKLRADPVNRSMVIDQTGISTEKA